MAREFSGPFTLPQCRALQARLRSHLELPSKGVNVGNGPWAQVPDTYSRGAIGWTRDEIPIVFFPTRGEYRLELNARVKALIGQAVGGSSLSLGAIVRANDLGLTEDDVASTEDGG